MWQYQLLEAHGQKEPVGLKQSPQATLRACNMEEENEQAITT